MASITLHSENNKTVTCVPNSFIDDYMADADGEFVKIYLYLLRCMNASEDSFSISDMADKFEHTEKDIKRALKYWEKMHILCLEYDSNKKLTGICLKDNTGAVSNTKQSHTPAQPEKSAISKTDSIPAATVPETKTKVNEEPEQPADTKPEYSLDEMKAFRQDKAVQELLFITETYLGHTLNTSDINSILYWHDSLHFSIELIEYLIEYCVCKGHKNVRYMEKVALAWHKDNITTVDEAKHASSIYTKANSAVMKAFGISGRNLVENETSYIEKWTSSYGFSLELVVEACKRTMQAIHQPSFEYTDSILSNWSKKKVTTLEEISALDAAYLNQKNKPVSQATGKTSSTTNRFNNIPQRSYDFDKLEKQLLSKSMH